MISLRLRAIHYFAAKQRGHDFASEIAAGSISNRLVSRITRSPCLPTFDGAGAVIQVIDIGRVDGGGRNGLFQRDAFLRHEYRRFTFQRLDPGDCRFDGEQRIGRRYVPVRAKSDAAVGLRDAVDGIGPAVALRSYPRQGQLGEECVFNGPQG